MVSKKRLEEKIEIAMNEWWDDKHRDDLRMSGDFSWEEIKEFGVWLVKRLEDSE